MPLLDWRDRDMDLTRAALSPYRLLEPVAKLHYGDPDTGNKTVSSSLVATVSGAKGWDFQ